MFRQGRRTARLLGSPRLQSRSYSAKAASTGRVLPYALAGFSLGVGATLALAQAVPRVEAGASLEAIAVASPVKVLSLQEANEKLHEGKATFTFGGKDGARGRVDVVRVASNTPVEDEWAVGVGKGVGGGETLFAGVYDGHAGWATSAVLKDALIRYVSTSLGQLSPSADDETVVKTIETAFTELDTRIMATAQKAAESYSHGAPEAIAALAPAIAGSCALLAVYDPARSILRTAVTGDSRAVLGSWSAAEGKFSAEKLSEDQTGFNAAEVARLEAEHPGEKDDILSATSGRLLGLAVTRAFGDHRWKWTREAIEAARGRFWAWGPRPQSRTPPYLTARPEVTTRRVQTGDFAILASDGLWDVMTNEDAVACVERWVAARRAGRPEAVAAEACASSGFSVDGEGYSSYKSRPEAFAIEDLDNAAVCLARNAFGGRRRDMFRGIMTAYSPVSRYVRDDVTVQVIFFTEP
ncbi:phosphatase 2C-like domain-containing protein [Stachybotrys elegans]|uniref:Phosphatase 2C-like domain-containing protein n=1 Tax=Stachybotrys elegans TaxID=80388 RepID=A0A8K0SF29_9HYPO|nr:phosphatase 2C-like domain-containing protein [Stachybotrys elegans]